MMLRKIVAMVLCTSIVVGSATNVSYANLDMGHNYKEDGQLLDTNWYVGPCKNGKDTCKKNLIRYDGIPKLVDYLNDLKKNATDEKEESFWAPFFQKAGILVASVLSLIPLIKKVPALVIMLSVLSYKFIMARCEQSEELKKEVFGKGLLEMAREYLFGDRIVTVLKKEQKIEFAQKILDNLFEQIKNKKWENNDILLLTVDIDPKVMKSGIKFDNVSFPLKYKKPLKSYFKSINIKK